MELASVFLLPNGTFFVELFIFLVIVFLVTKYILPPLNKAMDNRREEIRSSLEAADAAKRDAEAADDERRVALDAARHQAREILAQANRTADQVGADAHARGQSEFDRIVAAAESEVRLARQRAIDEASAKIGELVVEVVEKVIAREVDPATHRDLIDAAVASISADAKAAG